MLDALAWGHKWVRKPIWCDVSGHTASHLRHPSAEHLQKANKRVVYSISRIGAVFKLDGWHVAAMLGEFQQRSVLLFACIQSLVEDKFSNIPVYVLWCCMVVRGGTFSLPGYS